MATHSSILAWKIPWTKDPGSPQDSKESDTTEKLTPVWCSPISLFLLLFPLSAETAKRNTAETDVKEHTAYIFFYKFYGFGSYIYIFNPFFTLFLYIVWEYSQLTLLYIAAQFS